MRTERIDGSEHPTSAQVDAVAKVFERLATVDTNKLNMLEYNVVRNGCGTVACHGGWFLYHALTQREHHWTPGLDDDEFLNAAGRVIEDIIAFRPGSVHPRRQTSRVADMDVIMRGATALEPNDEIPDYYDGSAAMATALGFRTSLDMINYFDRHADIWGNGLASVMMHSSRAFLSFREQQKGIPCTLKHVARRWRGVHRRIRKMEREQARAG